MPRRLARDLGAKLIEIDLTPFFETARLLYEGAWVAERTAAVGDFIAEHPDTVHPVTRQIISQGEGKSAVDAFRGLYRLQELRAQAYAALAGLDALMVPTMPRPVTVSEVEADPIGPNSQLGTYTNFVNLLDLAGIAVPIALAADGTPFGVTLLGHAGRDAALASIGMAMHARTGLHAWCAWRCPSQRCRARTRAALRRNRPRRCRGAHVGHGAQPRTDDARRALPGDDRTVADYRLFALAAASRPSRACCASPGAGAAIAVETWALSAEAFGAFVAAVPSPLSIGTIRLGDGRSSKVSWSRPKVV